MMRFRSLGVLLLVCGAVAHADGLPNLHKHEPEFYQSHDWTDGCIALSNADMTEIWMLTPDDVPIDILP